MCNIITKAKEILRKEMTLLLLCLAIFNGNVKADYIPDSHLTQVNAKVCQIKTKRHDVKISLKVTQKGRWKGHIYSFTICKCEFSDWQKEEGKVKKNTKVKLLLDNRGTRKVTDDRFVNCYKR